MLMPRSGSECEESVRLIKRCVELLRDLPGEIAVASQGRPGFALGYAEGWRGPVLYWVRLGALGRIERCKIVDASFNNWLGLAHCLPGNIIPDFPVCNKSFDLSYSGNDL